MKHPEDFEIQEYIDGGLTDRREGIKTHLMQCKSCREKARAYASLFRKISEEPIPDIAPSVINNVMSQIESEKAIETEKSIIPAWAVSLGGLVLAFIATAIFFDFSLMWEALQVSGLSQFYNDFVTSTGLQKYAWGIYIIFALLFVAGLDFVLKKFRRVPISYLAVFAK